MTRMTRDDVASISYGMFCEAAFMVAGIVCRFKGHVGFEWQSFDTAYGPMRARDCKRCGKVENDYSTLNERGKEIVGIVHTYFPPR
jgi:hypothetical protein